MANSPSTPSSQAPVVVKSLKMAPRRQPVDQYVTFAAGAIFSLALFIICSSMLKISGLGDKLGFFGFFAFAIIFVGLFFFGLVEIDTAHHGVVKLFGKRIRIFVLGEGSNWIIPVIMSVRQVDMRKQITEIPATAEEKGISVFAIVRDKIKPGETPTIAETASIRQVEMLGRVTVTWQIVDAVEFLSINPLLILNGIRDLAITVFRQDASQTDDISLMQQRGAIAQHIVEEFDNVSVANWSIDALEVMVSKIIPANDEMIKADERATIEERQRTAETIEMDHVRARTAEVAKSYETLGMPKDEAVREAILTVRAERGKATQLHISGNAPSLVKAGALAGAAIKPNTP